MNLMYDALVEVMKIKFYFGRLSENNGRRRWDSVGDCGWREQPTSWEDEWVAGLRFPLV